MIKTINAEPTPAIIAGASVNMVAHKAQITELQESASKLSLLVEEVRDSALQLRMVKIGATFSRFQRVVHDVSRDLGKEVELVIRGEDTELDKTVVEKIGDPLMHLVRNSMDHGIEAAELRMARGKPAKGTLKLNAFHDSGSIVITVQDDGGGLKRERILAKATERGLVEAGHQMTDAEVYALIFEPGFSTAEKVTNLSGRGVGLDVVKRNITALRGTVALSSEEGVGTTVTVRLPLTLAIIDGFLIGVGTSVYAIALDMIEECIAFSPESGHDFTNLRGQISRNISVGGFALCFHGAAFGPTNGFRRSLKFDNRFFSQTGRRLDIFDLWSGHFQSVSAHQCAVDDQVGITPDR